MDVVSVNVILNNVYLFECSENILHTIIILLDILSLIEYDKVSIDYIN